MKRGTNCGFKSMGNRMKEANGLIGMVKCATKLSSSKYVIVSEGWKTMIVNKLMYGYHDLEGDTKWSWQMAMGNRNGKK